MISAISFPDPYNLSQYWFLFAIAAGVFLVLLLVFLIAFLAIKNSRNKLLQNTFNENEKSETEQNNLSSEVEWLTTQNDLLMELYSSATVESEALEEENVLLYEELDRINAKKKKAAAKETAIDDIEETFADDTKGNIKYTVKFDRLKNTWVIKKDGVDRAIRRVATKDEAMRIARELVKKYDAVLAVHKKDGKFQKH